MQQYKLWDRQENINGKEASYFLNQLPFKNYDGDIILIYGDNGKVHNIECKSILAKIYEIDITLPLDEFMKEYFNRLEETKDVIEE